jgi:MFS family permease
MTAIAHKEPARLGGLWAVVGVLVVVEFTSGILQGYYTPLLSDIARMLGVHDADVNWLEGTQLMVSTIVVPAFARLGDMVGHKRMLTISLAITAAATLLLCVATSFWSFLLFWGVQGVYTVWLPLEISVVYTRARHRPDTQAVTRRASGLLVAALETGVILGALAGGALGDLFTGQLWMVLLIPGIIVSVCLLAVAIGVQELPGACGGTFDGVGLVLVGGALLALAGGLSLMRAQGPGAVLPWSGIVLGLMLLWPFARHELRTAEPLLDVRMLARSEMWPVQLTAGLFGVSVLGAQVPLSTFARTDAARYGYGLSASSGQVSLLIGGYVLSLLLGALAFPVATRLVVPRVVLIVSSALVGVGYGLFFVAHSSFAEILVNMVIAGLGSGALVAALPAAAAAAAPPDQTGVATGLTNTVKTLGGAFASCVFGVALMSGESTGTAGSLTGYFVVWGVCAGTAFASMVCLCWIPRNAFGEATAVD